MNPDAEKPLSKIVAELERAWNAGDGDAFGRPFTEDADFVTIRAEHFRTRAIISRGHQGIFDSIYKDSTLRFEVAAARLITPTVILGHVKGKLQVPSGPMAGEHASFATLVLEERQGVWQIAAFHNMVAGRN